MNGWRDVDRSRRRFGFVVGRHGLTLHLGRRVYRLVWSW